MSAEIVALSLTSLRITPTIVVFGLIVGSTYGILAVGLVLIYRVSKIINFAHGEIGAFGAAFLSLAVNAWHVPYWVAFPGALAIAAGMGGLVEVGVIRRLRNAPRLMSVIATLGFAQFLAAFSLVVDSQSRTGSLFPEPPGLPAFHVGRLLVTPALTGMLFLTPLVAVALALFLRFSRYGIAMRAASANPESARLDGISAARMSTIAWMIAGAVAGITAILILPTQTYSGDSFGPSLLVSALTAAVLARMSNLVVAYGAGLAVGVLEQVLLFNNPSGGEVQAILFAIILVALLFLQPRGGRGDEKGSAWATLQGWRPLPEAYRRVFLIRHGSKIVTLTFLAVAAAIPAVATSGDTGAVTSIFALGIVGLSIGVITGLAGQLSLGQFAIAAIGATAAIRVAHDSGNYLLGMIAGGSAGALASVIVGVPALRIRGLMLAVTTLSLALMSESWLLQQPWMLGEGTNPGRPVVGPWVLDRAKTYYYLGLVALAACLWLSHQVRRGGIGRILVALRDNEDAARAFTIGATGRKLQG
ncbi:MAG: ABC transporter permease, partial [Candidatus Dormibacteraeota bacterium]|nr:ABC transporter permease [Candidatus Dormibacteraeota bacterium]